MEQHSSGIWAIIHERLKAQNEALAHGTLEEATRILRNPAESSIFYGFDHISPEFTAVMERALEQHAIVATLWQDYLIRLAEAVGAYRLENPEGGGPWLEHTDKSTDDILSAIERRIGCRLMFPNVYPDEFGLTNSRGIVSYRAIQAIYLAYRIRSLVGHIPRARVLEIGAGLGRSAFYAREMGISDYTIIDLPMTGISQAYYLMSVCGETAVHLRGELEESLTTKIKILDPTTFLGKRDRYDLIVNCDSITEIDRESAAQYWEVIRKSTPMFLSINHEVNGFTVADLAAGEARVLRFPYWMRPGYAEEIVTF